MEAVNALPALRDPHQRQLVLDELRDEFGDRFDPLRGGGSKADLWALVSICIGIDAMPTLLSILKMVGGSVAEWYHLNEVVDELYRPVSATVTAEHPTVSEIDPLRLLGSHPPGRRLQPYLARDVDRDLDRAFASPGLVLVVHESGSGVRRSVYEALLRALPALPVWVWNSAFSLGDDLPRSALLWIDLGTGAPQRILETQRLLKRWHAQGRYAVVIVKDTHPELTALSTALAPLKPKVVHVATLLSEKEQERSGVRTAHELADIDALVVRHAAGYHADTDAGVDGLDITPDVRMLADLVVSRHVRPPLSIGLFGNWGSGKSCYLPSASPVPRSRWRRPRDATSRAPRTGAA